MEQEKNISSAHKWINFFMTNPIVNVLTIILTFVVVAMFAMHLHFRQTRAQEKKISHICYAFTLNSVKKFCGDANMEEDKIIYWSKKKQEYVRSDLKGLFTRSEEVFCIHEGLPSEDFDAIPVMFLVAHYKRGSTLGCYLQKRPLKNKKGFYITLRHPEK